MTARKALYALVAVLGAVALVCGVVLQLRTVAEQQPPAALDPAQDPGQGPAQGSRQEVGEDAGQDWTSTARREIAVLARWDRRRAAAYAAGDPAALKALYRRGSRAGAADLRMLREYADRGLRVRGMRTQLLSVDVVHSGRRRLLLDVTDRLVGAEVVGVGVVGAGAVGAGKPVRLPVDRADRRRISLVLSEGSWLVDEVRPATSSRASEP